MTTDLVVAACVFSPDVLMYRIANYTQSVLSPRACHIEYAYEN